MSSTKQIFQMKTNDNGNRKDMLKWLLITIMCMQVIFANAQARFIATGRIEYEKKVNMHKWLEDNSWTREMKDKMPVYRITYFDLLFDSVQSVFKTGREPAEDKWKNMWMQAGTEENVVHNDYKAGMTNAYKQVFEKKFLVQDSLLNIEWRISDETRTIAGFDCRKAVGRFYDSLYVVAFYTDQITIPGGPELYNGLPGVILGLAFPRFYTTWFATKVELAEPKAADFAVPNKGKKVTRRELMAQVKDVFEWGSAEEKQKNFWTVVL